MRDKVGNASWGGVPLRVAIQGEFGGAWHKYANSGNWERARAHTDAGSRVARARELPPDSLRHLKPSPMNN